MSTNVMSTSGSAVYVASRASLPERSAMWRGFRANGFQITATWIDEAGEGETGDFSDLWTRIAAEINRSESLVLYAEAGDFPLKGALIEVGMALALRKRIYAVFPGVELEPRSMRPVGSWLNHPSVTICRSVSFAMELAASPEPEEQSHV